jgi:hypothetical protein
MCVADFLKAAGLVKRMTDQYGLIRAARDLPGNYGCEAARVRLALGHVSFADQDHIEKLGTQVIELVKAQETLRGEIERDALLGKYAAELESLRAILPQIAAKAAIELGELARELRSEAAR